MKYLLSIFLLPLILSSCAVLINKDYTQVQVRSEIPNTTVQVLPDTPVYSTPVALGVLRSKKNLELRFRNDTMDTVFQIKSRVDPWVWGNLYTYGFGAIIDLCHPRGRTYPTHIQLTNEGLETLTNRQWRRRSWFKQKRGLILINFDWALMNFQTSYDGSSYLTMGAPVFNVGIGVDYYLSPVRSIGLNAGIAVGDIFEHFGSTLYSSMNSVYYRASFQYDMHSFRLNGGLSLLQQFVQNPSEIQVFDTNGSTVGILNEVYPVALGPAVGVEWIAGEYVTLGAQYMTGLYSFNTSPHWAYRDVVLLINAKLRLPIGSSRNSEPRPRSYKISDIR